MPVTADPIRIPDVAPTQRPSRTKLWVDLDNSPHIPFFRPILDELRSRNYEVIVTARDAYQVRELLEYYRVSANVVGRHYGKHKLFKALGTCWRAAALAGVVRKEKPVLALSHGSRACMVAATLLGIPNVTLADYEYVAKVPFAKPTWLMVPSVVPDDNLSVLGARLMKYPGIKEDVYLGGFHPDWSLRSRLGIPENNLLITVRPPATEAHYHNPESEALLSAALERFATSPETTILLLPRNKRQEAELAATWAESIAAGKILIPANVEDGLNLIWNSDLVISGGGTMNREAAAMGVPVYSIFRGRIGAVDRYLANEGRLVLLETAEGVRTKINALRRPRSEDAKSRNIPALETIVQNIVMILDSQVKRVPRK